MYHDRNIQNVWLYFVITYSNYLNKNWNLDLEVVVSIFFFTSVSELHEHNQNVSINLQDATQYLFYYCLSHL